VLVAVALALPGCSSCARQQRCNAGIGQPEVCRAMADECTTVIESRCTGECPLRCVPDDAAGRCVLHERSCPADTRIFDGRTVGNLPVYRWTAGRLSPAALALANQPISRETFDTLTEQDRRELCGFAPGDPCVLRWNEAQGFAQCAIPPDTCARCRFEPKPSRCIAVNTCSGVICL